MCASVSQCQASCLRGFRESLNSSIQHEMIQEGLSSNDYSFYDFCIESISRARHSNRVFIKFCRSTF